MRKVHPTPWLLMIGLTLSSCSADHPEPAQEVISGGGSITKIGGTPYCSIYRVFLPNEDTPVYVVEGGGAVSCGITR